MGESTKDFLAMDAQFSDQLTILRRERDASVRVYAIGRELSLAITHLEDAQMRLRCALAARDALKGSEGVPDAV